jgi:NAD(P)-dependent dehydrogenase (short-subunit alcohol dehydrogenase family)
VTGKVAIVTGAGQGLGYASACLLAREGASVAVADIHRGNGEKTVADIAAAGGRAIFIEHDVSSEASWEKVMEETLKAFGKLDVLVNNAGIWLGKDILSTTVEEWRRVMSVNLDGEFLGIKHAIPAMVSNGGGSIVNIAAAGGLVGTVDACAYDASKGGVRMLSKAAAIECSKAGHGYNIRVNSIYPGVTKTPMNQPMRDVPAENEVMLSWHPIGHYGEPEDIAHGVLFLASDESKFMTGAELAIDGGWTAQ